MNDKLIRDFNKFKKLIKELYEKYDGEPIANEWLNYIKEGYDLLYLQKEQAGKQVKYNWKEHYNRPEDLKVDIKYNPKVTYTPIRRHDNETNSDLTFYVTNCTKVVSPIYHDELENCRKEIQSMLNELFETSNNNLTRSLIKVKGQNIIDMYICEQKIPNFITIDDFRIEVNHNNIQYH